LGIDDWGFDHVVSPREEAFLGLMRKCFSTWKDVLKPRHHCVLIVGDTCSKENLRVAVDDHPRCWQALADLLSVAPDVTSKKDCSGRKAATI
jgi:hypothetical protein